MTALLIDPGAMPLHTPALESGRLRVDQAFAVGDDRRSGGFGLLPGVV